MPGTADAAGVCRLGRGSLCCAVLLIAASVCSARMCNSAPTQRLTCCHLAGLFVLCDETTGAAQGAASIEHAVAINNIDVASEYIQKLRQELEGHAGIEREGGREGLTFQRARQSTFVALQLRACVARGSIVCLP